MEFQPLQLFILVSLAFVACHAALTSEVYWKTVLPNTPMPKTIKDLLPSEGMEGKSSSVGVVIGGGGVGVDVGGGQPSGGRHGGSVGVEVGVGGGGVGVDVGGGQPSGDQSSGGQSSSGQQGGSVRVGGGVGVDVGGGQKSGGTSVNVRHGGGSVSIGKSHHGKPIYVGWHAGPQPFSYNYAAADDQLHDNPNVALFFLEKNMTPGTKMNLHFFKRSNGATFLPRQVAESIPFSSNKMTEILNRFSVKPNSREAETMKTTVKECEEPGIRGEEKFCATSLESMVDFSISKLGKNIRAISTTTDKETQHQEYSITEVEKMKGDNIVACHQQKYTYAIFYCHKTHTSKAYMVSLLGKEGTKAKALAVCHEDTSAWNPKHLAFKVLKVKPGSVAVCHFLPEDHIVWVPK